MYPDCGCHSPESVEVNALCTHKKSIFMYDNLEIKDKEEFEGSLVVWL